MLPKGARAGVAELADARDLKSREVTLVPVRARSPAPSRIKTQYGRLAQLGERRVRNAEVVGSIPISSTKKEGITM